MNDRNANKYLFLLSLLVAIFFFEKINLTNSDLGRHLKNGEMVLLHGTIPKTNLYSYTYPNFNFINHHWLSGVVFFIIHKFFSFDGLTFFVLILTFFTTLFFLNSGTKNWFFNLLILVFVIPLISARREVRPELFSYLFCGIYFKILYSFLVSTKNKKEIFILPILQLLWVNLHIYFFFGIFLVGIFFVEEFLFYIKDKSVVKLEKVKIILLVLFLCVVASVMNPFGLDGILAPLRIFHNYGYKVFENQSVWFIDKLFRYPPNLSFKLLFVVVILSWVAKIYSIIKYKDNFLISIFLISLTTTIMALFAIRNFALFAYFSIPTVGINFERYINYFSRWIFLIFVVIIFLVVRKVNPYVWNLKFDYGLEGGNYLPARFFIENELLGPVLNNYDIGSYLIYFLFPKEPVFVDNRPEAYPENFFKDIYVPMMEDEKVWTQMDKKYDFNVIFFNRNDFTPWGQKFLINRVFDPNWATVFVDNNTIIILKRNLRNKEIIKKFELPKDIFKVVKNK